MMSLVVDTKVNSICTISDLQNHLNNFVVLCPSVNVV